MIRSLKAGLLAVWLLFFTALTLYTGALTASLVGQPYPGLLVQPMLYVSPFQFEDWGVGKAGLSTIDHVLAVDGKPVPNGQAMLDRARAVPVGTLQRYDVTRAGLVRPVYVATRVFSWKDWADLFGFFATLAWEFMAIGAAVAWLRPDHPGARALAAAMTLAALTLLLFPDYNTTQWLALAWMGCFYMMGSAFITLALVFPQPIARSRWLLAAPGLAGLALALGVTALPLGGPSSMPDDRYTMVFAANAFSNVWMAIGFVMVLGGIAWHFVRAEHGSTARRQAAIALVGAGVAFLPMIAWAIQYSLRQTPLVPLAVAFGWATWMPVAIAYAIVRAHLFDIRVAMRRSALYVTMSAFLAGAYVLLATGMRLMNWGHVDDPDLVADLVTTALVVALALPARDWLQRLIDRWLFRAAYDAEQALEEASQSMTSLLDRRAIAERLKATIMATLQPEHGEVALSADGGAVQNGSPKAEALTLGWGDGAAHTLTIPISIEGREAGALRLGPKRSDTAYTDRDVRLLRTLANQSAIALANAKGVLQLQAFAQELEAKVAERTATLEATVDELKAAQAALVHAEKMAALGLLVGGVAHELNNPLTCITGSIELIAERQAELLDAAGLGPEAGSALRDELDTLMGACLEGADRATAIVQSLRNFSRQEAFELAPTSLAECLASTIALVRPAFKERVRFELEAAPVPPVMASAGHLNQVFMNLLVNACQAIDGEGLVVVTLDQAGSEVVIGVRDTGAGIPASAIGRIFEPFFTTKPPGKGTGLGLSICLGIMEKHGGRIEVASTEGEGTTFRLFLPVPAERTLTGAHHLDR